MTERKPRDLSWERWVDRLLREARERIVEADSESEVRRILAAINARIRHLNAHATAGPPSNVVPLDVEREVVRWRQQRPDDVAS